jgi:DNA repair photolyase
LGAQKISYWIFQLILLIFWCLAIIGFLMFIIISYLEKKRKIFILMSKLNSKIMKLIKKLLLNEIKEKIKKKIKKIKKRKQFQKLNELQ